MRERHPTSEEASAAGPASFEELVEAASGPLYTHFARVTGDPESARDLLQDTLLRAWKGLASYDLSRPFRLWIFRIGQNSLRNYLRRRRLEVQWLQPLVDEPVSRDSGPGDAGGEALACALRRLPVAAFDEHVQALDEKEGRLGKLRPESAVYRMRSRDNLEFLTRLAGRPAPRDLQLGNSWVSPARLTLAGARGKVVALVFRAAKDQRSAAFLGPLAEALGRRDDARLVTVSFLESSTPAAAQADVLRTELEDLGFSGPAGFDPDVEGKSLFRAFHATVGSATFHIADRDGRLVWFQQDPRGIDVDFALALLDRVAGR